MKSHFSQSSFRDAHRNTSTSFGGSLLKKKAHRHARPVSSKQSMHLVLKSTKATGRYSFRYGQNAANIKQLIESLCSKYGVKLIKFSNNFNHLHLHAKFSSRVTYLRFIRTITAKLAMLVTGTKKSNSLKTIFGKKRFWDYRPFSRIVYGFRGWKMAQDYIRLNQLEAEHVVRKREGRLKDLRPNERAYFENHNSSRHHEKSDGRYNHNIDASRARSTDQLGFTDLA